MHQSLFFYIWISNIWALLLKMLFFPNELPLYLCQKSILWAYFWTLYSVPLIYLPIFMPIPHCLDYCTFIRSLDVSYCKYSNFILFQNCIWINVSNHQIIHVKLAQCYCQLYLKKAGKIQASTKISVINSGLLQYF